MTTRRKATLDPVSNASRGSGRVRIIGGQWRRRVLDVVAAPGLRPTPDRVRETLFNWLSHARGGGLEGSSALDLFAGSGALGLEAASRGAEPVVLVERDPRVVQQLRRALIDLGATGRLEIVAGDAFEVGPQLRQDGRRFDIVFLDPPFGDDRLTQALALAAQLCSVRGLVYAESGTALQVDECEAAGFELYRADRAGDVFYHLLRRNKKND